MGMEVRQVSEPAQVPFPRNDREAWRAQGWVLRRTRYHYTYFLAKRVEVGPWG